MFTTSENKMIRQIRKFIGDTGNKIYNFWFIYDDNDVAINWEGGFELSEFAGFRNDYRITSKPGKYQITRTPLQ